MSLPSPITSILDSISNFFTIRDAIFFLAGSVPFIVFLYFLFKREWSIFWNLRRPIMIFKSSKEDMEVETKLLRDTKLFNVPEDPTNKDQDVDRIKNHSLVIIGYSESMKNFDKVFDGVKKSRIPLIVYTKNRIPDKVFRKLRDYSWYSTCQVPLRLLNDVFTILSTFPNKK